MKLKILALAESIVIVLLLGGLGCLGVYTAQLKQKAVPASLETEEETEPSENIHTTESYYRVSDKKIYLNDGLNGQIWLPVLEEVPACSYSMEQMVRRNGMLYYLEDSRITSRFGIDVSAHQGEIDWDTVAAAGVEFAMIRAGYRGYGSGNLVADACFTQNMEGALAAGLDVGVYFYSQAISAEEAVEEAEMVLSMIEGYEITYPVVYDWETVTTDVARTDGISVDVLTDCTIAFCDTVAAAGYTPMVYQNKRTSLLKLDLRALTDYDFWLAEYNEEATFYYDYDMWQYTAAGSIPGIEGDVDLNICFTDYKAKEN